MHTSALITVYIIDCLLLDTVQMHAFYCNDLFVIRRLGAEVVLLVHADVSDSPSDMDLAGCLLVFDHAVYHTRDSLHCLGPGQTSSDHCVIL